MRCGRIIVPENYAAPSGRSIALNVAIVSASEPRAGASPLYYIDGGPGDPATRRIRYYLNEGRGYRRHDYRGGAYGGPVWQGRDGRYYCRRDDGTTGLIVGGISGAVLGQIIAPGGSKTLGTIIGAGAGALIGRAIDDGDVVCR